MATTDYSRYAAGILGIIAAGCTLGLGGYITAWCWNIYANDFGSDFLIIAIVSWIVTFASTILLVYGSLKIMRKSIHKGSLANIIAGLIMMLLAAYFYFSVPLLPQFGYLTLLLFLPALLSGLIGLAAQKH